jgi:hypothetical protein
MINLKNIIFDHFPFTHGIAKNVIEENFYNALVEEFPKPDVLIRSLEKKNNNKFNKFSLSSNLQKDDFYLFINKKSKLKEFVNYLLSFEFKEYLILTLANYGIEFGVTLQKPNLKHYIKKTIKNLLPNILIKPDQEFELHVEFSSIPFKGGMIKPHTDSQHKFASIVIPIVEKNWKDKFNGGTNFLKPKNKHNGFNFINNTLEFDDTEIIKTISFERNQFLIFFKTYNSLHSVGPMTGDNETNYRNSLTLTLEKKIKL